MYSYAAYGLILQSELILPELIEAADVNVQSASFIVRVRLGLVDRVRPAGVEPASLIWATPRAVFLEYPTAGAYLVREGQEIVIDPIADADPRILRLFLLGPILAILLHQRGYLVLHASSVNVNGGAVAFVGDKGAGKSTMAAAMNARGHALVADDIVAVDTTGPVPLAYPGFPQLKLFPESAAQLGGDAGALPRVHPDFDKRARRVEASFTHHALPLRGVFELIDADSEAVESTKPQQAFMQLVRHSYVLSLLQATGAAADHFRQTVAVAGKVPIQRLTRRRSLEALPRVAKLVEDEVAARR